jgi:ribosomal silencing factor RsfS
MSMAKDGNKGLDPRGLDVHGAEPISHSFTITDADGNADVELNLTFPLTRKRHALLEHLLEEGYSAHEAYVLIAGGEIAAHIQAIKDRKPKS